MFARRKGEMSDTGQHELAVIDAKHGIARENYLLHIPGNQFIGKDHTKTQQPSASVKREEMRLQGTAVTRSQFLHEHTGFLRPVAYWSHMRKRVGR